jgi:hypothetical protein
MNGSIQPESHGDGSRRFRGVSIGVSPDRNWVGPLEPSSSIEATAALEARSSRISTDEVDERGDSASSLDLEQERECNRRDLVPDPCIYLG